MVVHPFGVQFYCFAFILSRLISIFCALAKVLSQTHLIHWTVLSTINVVHVGMEMPETRICWILILVDRCEMFEFIVAL